MVEIDKKLYQEIKDYCKLNNLVIKDFVNKLLRKSFTIEKYGDKPFAEIKPETGVIFCPYVTSETVETTLSPIDENIHNIPDKITGIISQHANKLVNNRFYSDIPIEENNGKIGKMELPDEPPYNNVMVTTEHNKSLEEQAIEKIKDLVENQVSVPAEIMEVVDEHFFDMLVDEKPVKTEEPKVVKKSRKRKLN